MKKKKLLYAALIAIVGAVACTKIISTDIGSGDIIPPVDGVTVKDTTLEVITNTFGSNTTSVRLEDANILGIYQDTAFGKTTGDVYVQMQPGYFPYRFAVRKDSITAIDSVVLIMQTGNNFFGDSTVNAGFRVFEINDPTFTRANGYPFDVSKTFSATSEITYNNSEQFVNPHSIKDSVKAFGDTVGTVNQMRLRLNNSFAQKLINLDTANYRTDSIFRLAFNGFKIKSTSGNVLLPVLPYGSRLAIYYKYTSRTDGSVDTTVNYFTSNLTTSASANNIVKDYSGTSFATLPVGDTTLGSEFIYLQASPGIYSRIKIPGVANLPNMLIYRAELIMDESPVIDSIFSPNLFVSGFENNRRILLKDATIGQKSSGLSYLDAYYINNLQQFGSYPYSKRDSINNRNYYQYNFKLTNHIQDVVKKTTPNYDLDIFVPFRDSVYSNTLGKYVQIQGSNSGGYFNINYPAISRTKLYGNQTNTSHKMRLHIVYSPIEN